jgi:RNA recognition motif-containing protein
MLRHIPNRVREQGLRDFLDCQGFAGKYDVVVLPCDLKTQRNRGYGFVNFINHYEFLKAMQVLGGQQVDPRQSKKITQVSVADDQLGYKA